MQIVRDRYTLFLLTGSILIASGFGVWLYAQSVVSGLDQLVNASATQEEAWRYSGALEWWRLQQMSLLNPLATILIIVGMFPLGRIAFWLATGAIKTRLKES